MIKLFTNIISFYFFHKIGRNPSAKELWGIYKESVELTSVYLNEGCGKTLLEINDTIPHTRIDMGYGYAERDLPQVSIRSECCSVPSF